VWQRAAGTGDAQATSLDKGLRCKTAYDGMYRTVIYGLYSEADRNGDGEVQLKDVASLVPDIDEEGQGRLQALFEVVDQDGSRGLSKEEVVWAAEKLAQPPPEGDSMAEGEHDSHMLTSLLARAGEQGQTTNLDSTVYCKRNFYFPGWGPYGGPYLSQDGAASVQEELESKVPQVVDSESEAYRATLTSLVQRAAGTGDAQATSLDKGLQCKTVRDGMYRTVIYGLYSEADRNGDGEVQLKDVASLVPDIDEEGQGRLQAFFQVADQDGSRGLSKEELTTVMETLEHPPQVASEGQQGDTVASLLARAGEQGQGTSLDSTIYCKRNYYFPGWGPYGGPGPYR